MRLPTESAFLLTGRVALVAGAGSVGGPEHGVGIGRACAVLMARYGARVAALDRDAAAAEETVRMISDEGGEAIALTADVADADALRDAVERCDERFGGPDVLVANVGVVGPKGTAETLDPDEWAAAMDVNVTAMMRLARLAVPRMRVRGGGSIVTIGSVAGLGGGYPHLSYATTKGAVVNLTRALAAQHGADGIRANCIAPGQLATPRILSRDPSPEMLARRRDVAPLRTDGDGWDAAHAALFLASDAARWITGAVLPVDAGLSAVLPLASPPESQEPPASPPGSQEPLASPPGSQEPLASSPGSPAPRSGPHPEAYSTRDRSAPTSAVDGPPSSHARGDGS